jgi:hypothetical protein
VHPVERDKTVGGYEQADDIERDRKKTNRMADCQNGHCRLYISRLGKRISNLLMCVFMVLNGDPLSIGLRLNLMRKYPHLFYPRISFPAFVYLSVE